MSVSSSSQSSSNNSSSSSSQSPPPRMIRMETKAIIRIRTRAPTIPTIRFTGRVSSSSATLYHSSYQEQLWNSSGTESSGLDAGS